MCVCAWGGFSVMSCHCHGATSYHTHTSLLSHSQKSTAVCGNMSIEGQQQQPIVFRFDRYRGKMRYSVQSPGEESREADCWHQAVEQTLTHYSSFLSSFRLHWLSVDCCNHFGLKPWMCANNEYILVYIHILLETISCNWKWICCNFLLSDWWLKWLIL